VCRSMKPGEMISPLASISFAPSTFPTGPTATSLSPLMWTSPTNGLPPVPSYTVAPRNTSGAGASAQLASGGRKPSDTSTIDAKRTVIRIGGLLRGGVTSWERRCRPSSPAARAGASTVSRLTPGSAGALRSTVGARSGAATESVAPAPCPPRGNGSECDRGSWARVSVGSEGSGMSAPGHTRAGRRAHRVSQGPRYHAQRRNVQVQVRGRCRRTALEPLAAPTPTR